MSFLGDFHFIRPAWLFLAPVAVLVWWRVQRTQDPLRGWRAVMDNELLDAMKVGVDAHSRWKSVCLLGGWLVGTIAVAGPTWKPEPSPFADDPVPVMLVLRAGDTMDLTDLLPSRMERARLKITDFANERKGQPLGLVAYAGSAHIVLPPTRDTSVVAAMAAEIDPAVMPKPGDDWTGAVRLARQTLGNAGGSVIVVADTMSWSNQAAHFEGMEKRVPIHFLAIARDDTPELDAIRQVAKVTGGDVTVMTADFQDVKSLVKATAKAPVVVGASSEGTRWAEAGWWLVPLLALLSLASFQRVCRGRLREVDG